MVPQFRDPVDAALLALADPGGPRDIEQALAPLRDGDANRFRAAAVEHRLVCALADALTQAGEEVDPRLSAIIEDDRLTRLRVSAVLEKAARALDAASVPWLTFKGPAISALMARPELRTFNDLDLLVAADRFEAAIAALVDAGMVELNHNWVPYLEHRVGEVPLLGQSISVDLHWHVVGLGRDRRSVGLDPVAMLARRRHRTIAGHDRPTFDAEDQLLHILVHTALSGAKRLDQLRDVAVVIDGDPVDWDVFAARARAAGIARLAAHPLERAKRLLGASIPEELIEGLGGRAVRGRRRRDGVRVGDLAGFRVLISRDTFRRELGAAAVRLGDRGRALARRPHGWDFTDASGRLYHAHPSGGEAVRSTYLRRVAEWV